MNRSRLVVVLVLLLGAVLGARLLLRGPSGSQRALDRALVIAAEDERQPDASLVAPSGSGETAQAPSPEVSIDTSSAPEARVAIREVTPEDIVVRVVDVRGQPVADLPLRLHFEDSENVIAGVSSLSGSMTKKELLNAVKHLTKKTDAKGRVVFEGIRELVTAILRDSPDQEFVTLIHEVTFKELPTHEVTLQDLEQEEIVTVQPDFGSIRGVVLEHDGRSGAHADEISLVRIEEEPVGDPFLRMHSNRFQPAKVIEGVAIFPFVELGQEWGLIAMRGGEFRERVQGLGPSFHGEEVEIRVQYGTREPILQFRVIGPAGFAYANSPLKLQLRDGIDSARSIEVQTDDRGVFIAYVNLVAYSIFGVTVRISTPKTAPERLEALTPQLEDLAPGINDMGTIQILPPAILARGVVVDESGQAVQGATVRIGASVDFGENPWSSSDYVEALSDAQGLFEITGAKSEEARSVWAFRGDARSDRQALEEGGAKHVLTLRNLPTCHVKVRLAPGVPTDQVHVMLVHEDSEGDSSTLNQNTLSQEEGEHGFTSSFNNVRPRTYDVRAVLTRTDEVLAEVTGVEVHEGGTIAEFDLTDRIFLHSVHMLNKAGEAAKPSGLYTMRPSGDDQEWSDWSRFNDSTLKIATAEAQIDLRLMPKAYREEFVLGLQGERTISLRDPLRVRFILDTAGELPQPPYSLKLRVALESQEVGKAHGGAAFSKNRLEIVYDLPAATTYLVGWTLFQAGENFAIEGPVLNEEFRDIEISDLNGEQVIRLPLDAEALTEMTRNPPWD